MTEPGRAKFHRSSEHPVGVLAFASNYPATPSQAQPQACAYPSSKWQKGHVRLCLIRVTRRITPIDETVAICEGECALSHAETMPLWDVNFALQK